MFEIDGKTYELKYSIGRIKAIEQAIDDSVMGVLQRDKGMLSLANLCVMFAYGLKESGSDFFVPPKTGMEYAEKLIESDGYVALNMAVIERLQEDCPFFFRVD